MSQQDSLEAPPGWSHLLFDEFKKTYKTKDKDRRVQDAYNPTQETFPNLPWYKIRPDTIDSEIDDVYDQLCQTLEDAKASNATLKELFADCVKLRPHDIRNEPRVTVVGQSGHGKSTLIHALLGAQGGEEVARGSSESAACTLTVVQYRQKLQDVAEDFQATVKFLEDSDLERTFSRQLNICLHFYEDSRQKPSAAKLPEWLDNKSRAKDIRNRFDTIHRRTLTLLELKQSNFVAETVIATQSLIRRVIEQKALVMDNPKSLVLRNNSIQTLWERIDDILNCEDSSLYWDLVHYIEIRLDSPLLKSGMCLIDCPGLGDSNVMRVTNANEMRRQAEYEILVLEATRVQSLAEDKKEIQNSLRFHEDRRAVIVITKADVSLTSHALLIVGFQSANCARPLPRRIS